MAHAKDAHSCRPVQGADVGRGFIEPLNPVRRHLLVEGKILGLETELGQNVLHWNALAAMRKPSLTVVKAAAVLVGHRFIVWRRRGHGAGDRIEQHKLQKAHGSGDLRIR